MRPVSRRLSGGRFFDDRPYFKPLRFLFYSPKCGTVKSKNKQMIAPPEKTGGTFLGVFRCGPFQ
jgi:hypothetical protein